MAGTANTDPMGGLFETHDYDPETRTFTPKLTTWPHLAKAGHRTAGKLLGKPISRSLSGINWVGFTDEELAALPAELKQ